MRLWTEEETTYLKESYGIITVKAIIKHLKRPYAQIMHKAKSLGLKSDLYKQRYKKKQDKIIHCIKTKGFQFEEQYINQKSPILFKCFCGNLFKTAPQHIIRNHTKSCGCKFGVNRRRGTEYVSGNYFRIIKSGAKARLIDFNISINYISDLLIKQNFKCSISGLPIIAGYNTSHTASLDRIDNLKGYIEGNVQWVHKDINKMKHVMSQEIFIYYCKEVAKNNGC